MFFEIAFYGSLLLGSLAKEVSFFFFAGFLVIDKFYALLGFFIWALSVYCSVLTTTEQTPNIPQEVRKPLEGKKFKDYDYTTDFSQTNIFSFMWFIQASALVAPYETLIVDMSEDDLLVAQEINHCQVQTAWNKHIEKTHNYPIYTSFQKRWKNFMFNFLHPMGSEFTLAIGAALEALFCWLVYFYAQNKCAVYKQYCPKSWVWTYHLLEEVEHTHLSVPEMRQGLSLPLKLFTFLAFDFLIVVPVMLPLTIFECSRTFPERVFCIRGLSELVQYVAFCMVVIPFAAMGQFCELILGLNWKAQELERLHKVWTESVYDDHCTGLFLHAKPRISPKRKARLAREEGKVQSDEPSLIANALARLDMK